jgi:hypothetical protein
MSTRAAIAGLPRQLAGGRALRVVVPIGVVSLFADMAYVGARRISGPFLEVPGATATAVGVIAGAGGFLGYVLRFRSGRLAERTHRYWAIAIAGYAVNLLAVPMVALAGHWGVAAGRIVLERTA